MNINPNLDDKDISVILNNINEHFNVLLTGICKSSSEHYSKEAALQQIKETEELLIKLQKAAHEQNLLGLPTDYSDVQSMAQNQKKSNDILKQTLNHSATSALIISKTLGSDLVPGNR